MKRFLLCVIFGGIVTIVWGQDLSFGNGIFIGNDFGGGFETKINRTNDIVSMPMHYFGGGGFVFFDATYTVTSFGFFVGGGKEEGTGVEYSQIKSKTMDFSFSSLNLGLLGKYPFKISEKLKIFPLLGFDYQIAFLVTFDSEKYDEPKLWNQFWFKLGGGLDCELSKRLYFRIEVLYGIRIATNGEKLFSKKYGIMQMQDYNSGDQPNYDVDGKTLLGHGLTVRIAIGYKLKNITE